MKTPTKFELTCILTWHCNWLLRTLEISSTYYHVPIHDEALTAWRATSRSGCQTTALWTWIGVTRLGDDEWYGGDRGEQRISRKDFLETVPAYFVILYSSNVIGKQFERSFPLISLLSSSIDVAVDMIWQAPCAIETKDSFPFQNRTYIHVDQLRKRGWADFFKPSNGRKRAYEGDWEKKKITSKKGYDVRI